MTHRLRIGSYILTSAGSGVACWVSFAPHYLWWAAIGGMTGLTIILAQTTRALMGGLYGMIFGLAFFLPLLHWVSIFVGNLPWIALGIMCAVFPSVFGMITVGITRWCSWPILNVLIWSGQEWLRARLPFGGFPWGILAYGQTNGPLASLAYYGGPTLVSATVVLIASVLAWGIVGGLQSDHVIRTKENSLWSWENYRRRVAVILIVMIIVSGGVTYCVLQVGTHNHSQKDHHLQIAIIQGNVPRLGLDFNAQRRAVLEYHTRQTLLLASLVHQKKVAQPQIVIWPENSADVDPLTDSLSAKLISQAAQKINAPILVGTVRFAHPIVNPWETFNTMIVWDPSSGPGQYHDKKIIQPFGEYLPWRGFFRHFSSYADRAGYFIAGHDDGVVNMAEIPIGIATCWEVIFTRALHQTINHGAQVLVIPSNNATFNAIMSAQQLQFARIRAIEHDRVVLVAATTGISALISPDGIIREQTQFFQPGFIDASITTHTTISPADHWYWFNENFLPFLGVITIIIVIIQNYWANCCRWLRRKNKP